MSVMFRYSIEITACAACDLSPTFFLELKCPRRGARSRIDHLPGGVVIRNAPAADTIVLSLVRDGRVTATGDPIAIGIPHRCMGSQAVQLLPVAGSLKASCVVTVMWRVEAEDSSVLPIPVVDYVVDDTNPQGSSASTMDPVSVAHKVNTNVAGKSSSSTTNTTSVRGTGSELSDSVTPCFETMRPKLMEKLPGDGNPIIQDSIKDTAGAESDAMPSVPSLPQCLNGPPHAPEGYIDYYATSTQVVGRPEAWANLYTSPSPLLEDSKSGGHPQGIDVKAWRFNEMHIQRQKGLSAVESIIRDPSQLPELPPSEAFRKDLYRRIKAPQGRKLISFTPPENTAKSRR